MAVNPKSWVKKQPSSVLAPNLIYAIGTSKSTLLAFWSNLTAGAQVEVYYSLDGISYSLSSTTSAGATTATISGLTSATYYYVKVRALKNGVYSEYSSAVIGRTWTEVVDAWVQYVQLTQAVDLDDARGHDEAWYYIENNAADTYLNYFWLSSPYSYWTDGNLYTSQVDLLQFKSWEDGDNGMTTDPIYYNDWGPVPTTSPTYINSSVPMNELDPSNFHISTTIADGDFLNTGPTNSSETIFGCGYVAADSLLETIVTNDSFDIKGYGVDESLVVNGVGSDKGITDCMLSRLTDTDLRLYVNGSLQGQNTSTQSIVTVDSDITFGIYNDYLSGLSDSMDGWAAYMDITIGSGVDETIAQIIYDGKQHYHQWWGHV